MNKVEKLKQEKDGLELLAELPELSRLDWQKLHPDDVERLKWLGCFLRKKTPGRFMIRIRITGGRVSSTQLETLSFLAETLGNGVLDLTTRQQVELRHITLQDIPAVLSTLSQIDLNSFQTGMDNIRNIVTCPVGGLTPDELFDAYPLCQKFTSTFLLNRTLTNLPRKFNVIFTGCLENCTPCESQDLAFVPALKKINGEMKKGFHLLVGGKMGSGGFSAAQPLDCFVLPEQAPAVALAVVSLFRDFGLRQSRSQARLYFLLEEWGLAKFQEALFSALSFPLFKKGEDARQENVTDHLGIHRQKNGLYYVGCSVPGGRLDAQDMREIARLAKSYGQGEVRLTTTQNFIFPHIPLEKLEKLLSEPLLSKYSPQPPPLSRGMVSCVGTDYCNLALIETKGVALWATKELEKRLGAQARGIKIYWSGCPAGCGNHFTADIGLQGIKARVDGKVIDAVQVYVGGKGGKNFRCAQKIMDLVPCNETLIDFLETVIRNLSILSRVERDKKSEEKILMVPVMSGPELYSQDLQN